MPINKITGVMLVDDLLRDGNDLAVETSLLYVDVNNSRVGFNTATPTETVDIIGPLKINNIVIDGNSLTNRNLTGFEIDLEQEDLDITGSKLINLAEPTDPQDSATKFYVDNLVGGISSDRIISGNSELVILDTGTETILDLTKDAGTTTIFSITDTLATLDVPLTSTSDLKLQTSGNDDLIVEIAGTGITTFVSTTAITIPTGPSADRPFGPEQGAIRFNQDLGNPEVFDGINWTLFNTSFASFRFQEITPDGISITYQLDEIATSESILVSFNGVLQTPDQSYTVAGNMITFLVAPPITDIISIRFIANLTAIYAITDAIGTTLVRSVNGEVQIVVEDTQVASFTNDIIFAPVAPNGIVSIQSATALTLPAGTTAERPAPAETGAIRFNETTNNPEVFDGTIWSNFADGGIPSLITDTLQTTSVETVAGEIGLDVSSSRIITIQDTIIEHTTSIVPDQDSTLNLGSTSKKYNNLYVGLINGNTPGTYGPDSTIDAGEY